MNSYEVVHVVCDRSSSHLLLAMHIKRQRHWGSLKYTHFMSAKEKAVLKIRIR